MSRAKEKAARLLQIEKLLWAHPEGIDPGRDCPAHRRQPFYYHQISG